MKNTITRVDALNFAISAITPVNDTEREVVAVLERVRDQIAKPRANSDESKAKRKEKNAQARATLMAQVLPIIREGIGDGGTAKDIFERCTNALPEDFTAHKVQYILLHELADEVDKTETKGKPNVYKIKRA